MCIINIYLLFQKVWLDSFLFTQFRMLNSTLVYFSKYNIYSNLLKLSKQFHLGLKIRQHIFLVEFWACVFSK